MENIRLESLRSRIDPYRQALISHPLYHEMSGLEQIRTFMESHVFAVWDFMSLLKSLQKELTCVDLPWLPKGNPATRFLINEIVTGEESDVDAQSRRISHFELYLEAMQQAGCDTRPIKDFVQLIAAGEPVESALQKAGAPEGAANFVAKTFEVIRSGKPHVMAGVFTFGREDLIPDMFLQIIRELKATQPDTLEILHYYVERHIEVDGGHHGHLALQMTEELCGTEEQRWLDCETAVIEALKSRVALWDSVCTEMRASSV